MTDIDAMDPCPSGKNGRHNLGVIVPDDDDHDLTFYCETCGALRRVPVQGALLAARLDDLSADAIRAAVGDPSGLPQG